MLALLKSLVKGLRLGEAGSFDSRRMHPAQIFPLSVEAGTKSTAIRLIESGKRMRQGAALGFLHW